MTAPAPDDSVAEFADGLRGPLLQPGDDGYDEARTVWNAMVDEQPTLIVRCAGTADVISAVVFAKEHDHRISVKGGGHNIAGRAVEDDALMIDVSPMNSVRVDPDAKTARVEPGVVLNELDHETQAFGLATPVGYNSTTGIAGLTLGGGWGWLSRKHGLTVDNLISADVVTADAELVHASEDANKDLFWGLRGGGGNFGIVTSLPFTAVGYWQTGSEVSLAPVIFGGVVAGYLATRRTGECSGVGVRAGLIGGLPIVWMLFDILTATSGLAGPAWFVTRATLLTIGFIVVFAVVGFGLSALVGGGGAKVGSWLAENRSSRQTSN
jgi:hypothetical protein